MTITKGTGVPGTDTTAPEYVRAARGHANQATVRDPAWRHAWNEGVRAERIRACAIVGEMARKAAKKGDGDVYDRWLCRHLLELQSAIDDDHTMIVEEP